MINDNSRYWLRMSSVAGSVDYNKKEEGVGGGGEEVHTENRNKDIGRVADYLSHGDL